MALNSFTDREAIEIAVSVRDKLELDGELALKERWKEKDALAQVINLAEKYIKEEKARKEAEFSKWAEKNDVRIIMSKEQLAGMTEEQLAFIRSAIGYCDSHEH